MKNHSKENNIMADTRFYKFLFVSAPFGGIEVFCRNIQKVVETKKNIEATWIWIDFSPKDFIARIPPISFNWTLKGGLLTRARIRTMERSGKKFDAAFFNHTIPLMFLNKFRKKVPVVLSVDITPTLMAPYSQWYRGKTDSGNKTKKGLKYKLTKNVYMNSSYILPWSNLVRESLINDYKISKNKLHVVPPGIDTTVWNSGTANKTSTPQKNNKVQILFVGGDFIRKGGDILLRIAKREEFAHCEFHFVTRSFQGEAGANVFVHSNVQANSNELLNLYRTADIFALPTRADLSPAVLCEAMAFQLPVVATKVGGLDEIVVDAETGYTVPANDEEAFAAHLKLLSESESLRRTFGSKGRTRVEEKYDIKKNAETVLHYLKRAVEERQNYNNNLSM